MTKQTLNVNILERFMTANELNELIKVYDNNKKQIGQGNRIETLNREISQQEKEMIVDYFNPEIPMSDLVKKYNVNQDKVRNTVYSAGIRMVYQKISL